MKTTQLFHEIKYDLRGRGGHIRNFYVTKLTFYYIYVLFEFQFYQN